MSDQFTSVSEQGLGGNLMDSIKGVGVGMLLFVLSFVVLWMNEGRVDLSEVAKKSVAVKADAVDTAANGKFVSVTGALLTEDKLGDPELLNPGNYIKLDRQVEMYSWIERKETNTDKKVGGKKVTTTTLTYLKDWTADPKRPASFERPEGHENPALPLPNAQFVVAKASVAAYPFSPEDPAVQLPGGETLKLSDDLVKGAVAPSAPAATAKPADAAADTDPAKATDEKSAAVKPAADDAKDEAKSDDDGGDDEKASKHKKKSHSKRKHHGRSSKKRVLPPVSATTVDNAERKAATIARRKPENFVRATDTYLFKGSGTLDSPQIGDARVSFRVLKPGTTVTMFARLEGGQLVAYTDKDTKLFRAETGTRAEAIAKLQAEHKTIGWALRIIGFFMMWGGMMLFFGPINALLDIVPFLGSAGRFLIGLAALPVALVLSTVTILLSMIAHSPILLALLIVGLAAGGYFFYQKKKRAG